MDDSTSSTENPVLDASDPGPTESSPENGAPKKKLSPWAWVGIAAAVILVLGAIFASSSSSGLGGVLALFGGQNVDVPLVLGQPQSQAESLITEAGLRVGKVSEEPTLGVAPGLVVAQTPAANTKVKEDSAVDIYVSVLPQVEVPDVTGETESAASAILAEQGLLIGAVDYANSSSVPAGKIIEQDPAAKSQVKIGSAVGLTVSKGAEQGQVPNVVGLSQADAEATLEGAGFEVKVTKATSTGVPAGDVMVQSPAAGVVTAAGSTVTITVSTGAPAPPEESTPPPADPTPPPTTEPTPPPTTKPEPPAPSTATVPDVVGMRPLEAVGALRDAKLKFSIVFAPSTEYVLKVSAQDPEAGAEVEPGTAVQLTIGMPSFSLEKPTTLPAPAPSPGATSGVAATSSP